MGAVLRALRHPLRALVATLMAWAVLGEFTTLVGLLGALLGVVLGLAGGELLGRSRVRVPVSVGILAGTGLGAVLVGWLVAWSGVVPMVIGPASALQLRTVLLLAGTAVLTLGLLRLAAVRLPALVPVELGVYGLGLAAAFAAHRDGSVAQPVWLADRVWRWGLDPAEVLLAVGALTGLALALILYLDSEERRPLGGLVLVPLLVLLAWIFVDVGDVLVDPVSPAGGLADALEQEQQGSAQGGEGEGEDASGSSGGQGESDSESDEEPPPPEPVAVVILRDDYVPPLGYWYLRHNALSEWSGSRLLESDVDVDVVDQLPVERLVVEHPFPEDRERVRGLVASLTAEERPMALTDAVTLEPAVNPDPTYFARAWTFDSLAWTDYADLLGRDAGDSRWSPSVRDHYTEAPPDPRYYDLAEEILADQDPAVRDDPFATAVVLKLWLDQAMTYDSHARHAGVEDPTADFLFGDLTGYCVHSAHAMVYLMRTQDIPARVGLGYAVPDEERRGATLLVMSNQGHAWPELYLEGAGWVVLDVAPAQSNDGLEQPPDEELLKYLTERARQTPEELAARPDLSWLGRSLLVAAALLLVLLALCVGFLHGLAKLWRRTRLWWAPARGVHRVGYRQALDHLAACGLVRTPGETRSAFAARLELPAFSSLNADHLRVAMGDPSRRTSADRGRWREGLRELRRELRQRTPWWRRILGVLDPTTLYRVR